MMANLTKQGMLKPDSGEPMYVTATLAIDQVTGKIIDIGLINEYDENGVPQYGCMRVTRYYGKTECMYKYGYGPTPEQIAEMRKKAYLPFSLTDPKPTDN